MIRTAVPFIAIWLIFFDVRAISASEPLLRAAIVDGQVYVSPLSNADGSEPNWKELGGRFTLLGQTLAKSGPIVTLKHHQIVESNLYARVPHRWQLDRTRMHSIHYAEAQTSGIEPFMRHKNIWSCPLKLFKTLETPLALSRESDLRRQEFERNENWEIAPVLLRKLSWHESQAKPAVAHFDFLPTPDDRYEWYVSEPDGARYRIARSDSQLPLKKGDPTKWTEIGVWTADFNGPFFAVSSGAGRYFVNGEGHVYSAPRAAKPAKAGTPLKVVWTGKIPVDVLIHDADNAKWYAFTKDQYFEVTDPIKSVAHTASVRRAKTATEALETAAKCGRVIRGLPEPKAK